VGQTQVGPVGRTRWEASMTRSPSTRVALGVAVLASAPVLLACRPPAQAAAQVPSLTVLELGDSDQARVGEWVMAIGNPFGLSGSATVGVQLQPMSAPLARSLDLSEAQGALVADVVPGSPADATGMVPGDVILGLDGAPVGDPAALNRALAPMLPGRGVELRIWSGGAARTVSAVLEAFPDQRPGIRERAGAGGKLGLSLHPLTHRAAGQPRGRRRPAPRRHHRERGRAAGAEPRALPARPVGRAGTRRGAAAPAAGGVAPVHGGGDVSPWRSRHRSCTSSGP
jgi:hypothetical protein